MKVLRAKAGDGFTWFYQSLRLYGTYTGSWISMGLFLSLLSMISSFSIFFSIVVLLLEPVFIGLFFYFIYCRITPHQMPMWYGSWTSILKKYFTTWLGLSVVLLFSMFIFYVAAIFIFIKLAALISDLQMNGFFDLVRAHNFSYATSYYVTHYDIHWVVWLLALACMMIFVLVQTASLYAPALIMAEDLGYKKNMKIAQSIFSSIVLTSLNWAPLLLNSFYFLLSAFVFMSGVFLFVLFLVVPFLSQGIYFLVFLFSLLMHCVLLPILAINIFLSFSAVFPKRDSNADQ